MDKSGRVGDAGRFIASTLEEKVCRPFLSVDLMVAKQHPDIAEPVLSLGNDAFVIFRPTMSVLGGHGGKHILGFFGEQARLDVLSGPHIIARNGLIYLNDAPVHQQVFTIH